MPQQTRTLPESRSFFGTGSDHIVLSTMKKGEDDEGIVVRLYEADGAEATASLSLPFGAVRMEKTNMIEEEGRPWDVMAAGSGLVPLTIRHHAVETLKFFRSQESGKRAQSRE